MALTETLKPVQCALRLYSPVTKDRPPRNPAVHQRAVEELWLSPLRSRSFLNHPFCHSLEPKGGQCYSITVEYPI